MPTACKDLSDAGLARSGLVDVGLVCLSKLGSSRSLRKGLARTGEGLITYMRTDGVAISSPAVQDIRQQIKVTYGEEAVAAEPRMYQ